MIILFVTSMAFTLLSQPTRPLVGSVSVGRDEDYWQNFKGNTSMLDSRYLINYVVKVSESSSRLTITDKTRMNMTQIVITPEYSNLQMSYDPSNGKIKIELINLVEGENYTIQIAFQVPPQDMFDGAAPATTCKPMPSYGYSGRLEVDIAPFKVKDADKLKEVGVYSWFTVLVTNKTIMSSSPAADALPPDYEAIWVYKSPTAEYGAHMATYNVTITPDKSSGDVLLRTWIEAYYEKGFMVSSDPIFDGAEASFKNLGAKHILSREYTIDGSNGL